MTVTFPERFGRYTLLQRVAFGGMAEILLAIEDTAHAGRRFVTIKRILREYAADPDYIDFFISEGRVSMQCSHPNLTNSFDLDTVDGEHYLAMEYIRGHTLLDLIRACHRDKVKLTIPAVLRIASEVAAGLEHLHAMRDVAGKALNVVHRDVTPQNIMIDAAGSVKLIDLGIARSDMQVHKTEVGTVKGKLSYIAPEQLDSKRTLDQRADIFSLGIVIHEAMTSRGLFRGKNDSETLRRVRKMPIPEISSIRPEAAGGVDRIAAKCLERKPEARYQNASEFLRALDELPLEWRPCSLTALRDEVLEHCGDPPVPTLSGEAFGALRKALRVGPEDDAPAQAPSIQYFLKKASVDGEEE